jgi:hypothetical protein
MSDNPQKLLDIYLNDHYLAANSGVALADRIAKALKTTIFGDEVAQIAQEIRADLGSLVTIMKQLGVQPQRWRAPVGIAVERIARLKLNGHHVTRSPLSTVLELEGLVAGVEAKRCGWQTIRQIIESDGQTSRENLGALVDGSLKQTETLHLVRAWAVEQAFVDH